MRTSFRRSTSVEVSALRTTSSDVPSAGTLGRSTSVEVSALRTQIRWNPIILDYIPLNLCRGQRLTHQRSSDYGVSDPLPLNLCRGQRLTHARLPPRYSCSIGRSTSVEVSALRTTGLLQTGLGRSAPLNLCRGQRLTHSVSHLLQPGSLPPLNLCRGQRLTHGTQ